MLPTVSELMEKYRHGDISRRDFIRTAGLLGLSLTGISTFLASCSSNETTTTTAATGGETTSSTAAAGGIKRGGTLVHALPPVQRLDPAFLTTIADDQSGRTWHDFLVFLDEDMLPDPARSLAESWDPAPDGTQYTFHLRKGVVFHDGKPMTSKDVKFTFDRLRDPKVGGGSVDLYKNIKSIEGPDDLTVVFTLTNPNPDFPLDLGDYHALIVDSTTTNFDTQFNATGPYMVEKFAPEDRLTFKKNPKYWMMGEDGQPLPYPDGYNLLFLNDPSAQVDALRGGQASWINYLSQEFVQTLEGDSSVTVARKTSNFHFVIRMRSDRGPAKDVKVRQALKAATDRSAILQTVALGYGSPGRDTPIGPAYGDYYLDVPEPKRDVVKAKQLLAEAGHPNGLQITLTTQNSVKVPDIATVWKEQLAEAGITVKIELVPVETYYGANNLWLEADFAITDWAARPYPQPYLTLAYITGAVWNESHWSDPELDDLAKKAAMEMDHAKRVALFHQIQQIFMDRGPIIVPFFGDAIIAFRKEVKPGIKPAAMNQPDVRSVWLNI
jgi:peptide/nickel transport system substrate-binding protein